MNKKLFTYRLFSAIFIGLFVSVFFYFKFQANSAPLLANYFLNQLPTDNYSLDLLAKNNLLIITPAQAVSHPARLAYIRARNPDIIIMAYVPSQSYNTKYWSNDIVFKNFQVQNNWWLRNEYGQVVEYWPTLSQINMNTDFSNYLVDFCNQHIANIPNVNGIFFDMVSDGISWVGNVDLNSDGVADEKKIADAQWLERVQYFLQLSKQKINTKYLIINGNSNPKFQPYVNGRMFESFPASWDWGGNWSTIMNYLVRGKKNNSLPTMVIINSGTNNTGNKNDYKKMRFGLASSLMEDDVYYSFDYGEDNHGQIWWYDEYDVALGDPTGKSISQTGLTQYGDDVWRRDYTNGVALVNSTNEIQTIDLGADYEKIIGKQDPSTNDGAITNKVQIKPKDGLVMLKTAQNLYEVPFKNGNFVRFFDNKGNRVRNGFFTFVSGVSGGARVYLGDLDNENGLEKIVGNAGRIEIFNSANQHWFDNYPYGGNYSGEVRYSVGKIKGETKKILVVPVGKGSGFLYTYYGELLKEDFFPFGKKYTAGFYGALGNFSGGSDLEVVVGSGGGRIGEVLVFDKDLQKIKYRFYPYDKKFIGKVKVVAGDTNGDGKAEIITMAKIGTKYNVRTFDVRGKKLSEFTVSNQFGNSELEIGATDVNFDGVDDIVVEGN